MSRASAKQIRNHVMPLHAPYFGLPPYIYGKHRQLNIICEGEEESIREVIPEPLEYAGNIFTIWMFSQGELDRPNFPFDTYPKTRLEAGIMVQAKYKQYSGAHCPYIWVEPAADDSLAAGRELQGFPKKLADMTWKEEVLDDAISFSIRRRGVELMHAKTRLTGKKLDFKPLSLKGTLQVKTFPKIDGSGPDLRKIVLLENVKFEVVASKTGTVDELGFGRLEEEPVYRLKPKRIYGCEFSTGSGRVENPCGREIEDLLKTRP